MARDHARLPFQWDGTPNSGFSTGKPWMRVHDEYPRSNVASQEHDPESVLSFYKQILRLRKEHKDVFVYGSFELLDPRGKETFLYRKKGVGKTAVVVLNFTAEEQQLEYDIGEMRLLVSSYSKETGHVLRPLEGRIYVDY